jgi:hypothetical protein
MDQHYYELTRPTRFGGIASSQVPRGSWPTRARHRDRFQRHPRGLNNDRSVDRLRLDRGKFKERFWKLYSNLHITQIKPRRVLDNQFMITKDIGVFGGDGSTWYEAQARKGAQRDLRETGRRIPAGHECLGLILPISQQRRRKARLIGVYLPGVAIA